MCVASLLNWLKNFEAKRLKKEVVIPRLGSSDESDEVKILRWLKRKGDVVKKGEALLEVETDKVNVEIEAPNSGRLSEIHVAAGQVAKFNAVVAVIEGEE
jgi:pyruvate/2-oxoglutarate dehydrogenase complex dihydrolipoamide acyltransferase (E2) component